LRLAPPLPFLPTEAHGTGIVALALCYAGDPKQGERVIGPLRTFGSVLGEHVGVQPYTAWQQTFDPLLSPGARNYWKSHNFTELSDGLIDVIIDTINDLPSPHCEIFIGMLGSAYSRVAPDATAYTHRDAQYVINVHARWETPAEDSKCIGWARDFFQNAAPFATGGVYVNFMTEEEGDRIQGGAYKSDVLSRLTQIKNTWDPKNFFRMNQNIKPTV